MQDIYRQNFIGLVHDLPLAEGVNLRSDLRYFDTREQGSARLRSPSRVDGGRIDNRFFNGMFSLSVARTNSAWAIKPLRRRRLCLPGPRPVFSQSGDHQYLHQGQHRCLAGALRL